MVEALLKPSEDLMNEYLENGDLSEDQIHQAIAYSVLLLAKFNRCFVVLPSRTKAFKRHA
jgi:translation elongation factor EF-G